MQRPWQEKVATASLILGLVAIVACVIPPLGCILSVTGLVAGISGVRSSRRPLAIAGIIVCAVALLFANFVAGITGDYEYTPGSG